MSSALTSQRFCLRWNNHQSNLLTVFDQLLHDESFVDVTLAVEGRFLRAHKMVLSACSPYFQALFVGHPDKHPIVILKDVPYCDMRSLLDFMYRGEVSVDQERLTAFLKVAESLRIKGLTEVNEDRCDLPTITSSLLSTAVHSPSPPVPPPPPHLHRIHPTGHKRAAPPPATAANPLLGSALTAPKRKRGRPRKLSGSSPGPGAPPNLLPAAPAPAAAALSGGGLVDSGHQARGQPTSLLDGNDLDASRLGGESIVVQGSPEMLEVKMGTLDFQQNSPPPAPTASSTPSASGGGGSSRADTENGQASPELSRGSSGKDLGTRRIKEEPEPAPGPSSQDPGQAFIRSGTDQDQQAFALDSLGLLPKVQASSSASSGGGGGGSSSTSSGAPPGPGGGGGGGGGGSGGSGSTTAATTTTSQQPEGNELGGGGASSSSGTSGAGQPGAPAPPSAPGPSPAAPRQPPVKRRARRRATSASQDPAEALTEMSVRGLNLFRYASISEGVYKCTECAKVDVQKTFKNKYSFQRHAFLYHEGHQRKVFPCPVCAKEFSRPDKMKNHMKTVHDCFMPKDCGFPLGFFTSFP